MLQRHTFALLSIIVIAIHGTARSADDESVSSGPLSASRITEIKSMIADGTMCPLPDISDRAAWNQLAKSPMFGSRVKAAEDLLSKPLPSQPDELYLEFSRNGTRVNWEKVAFARRGRVAPLVIAECV